MQSKAWPYEEARRLLKRWAPDGPSGGKPPKDGKPEPMLFETGYGPSGLPHIGTFNEVLRTTFVRNAYHELTGGAPSRLVAFSDDMDGLRKVPDNLPNQQMLTEHLGKPKASLITTMRCCARFSTGSASITNFSRRPTATRAGASTRWSGRCCASGTR
jgi:lysyl-tRNA synthetase class I